MATIALFRDSKFGGPVRGPKGPVRSGRPDPEEPPPGGAASAPPRKQSAGAPLPPRTVERAAA